MQGTRDKSLGLYCIGEQNLRKYNAFASTTSSDMLGSRKDRVVSY